MTKLSMALLVILLSVVFVTCTGCAAIHIDGQRVDGFVIGQAEMGVERSADAASQCLPSDYQPTNGRTLIYSSKIANCDQAAKQVFKVTLKGGPLSPGWFGVLGAVAGKLFGGVIP